MTMTTTPATSTTSTVRVDAADLKAALAKLKPVLPAANRHWAPTLSCVAFSAFGSVATLTATNVETALTATIPVDGSGQYVVPAVTLNKLLSVRSKGTVEITTTGADGYIKSGNVKLGFETPDDAFPLPPLVIGRDVALKLDVLPELLPAMSTDDTRPILTSVCIDHGTYVSTDSYRLHIVETGTDTGDAFLVPRDAAKIMAKYTGTPTATVSATHLNVDLDDSTTLTVRLIDGEFPPFRRLVPTAPAERITFTDELAADLKTLVKVRPKDETTVLVASSDVDQLTLSIGNVEVTTTGSASLLDPIGFGATYLLDLIAGTTSNTLQVTDRLKPVMIREAAPAYGESAERVRIIMPVRLQ